MECYWVAQSFGEMPGAWIERHSGLKSEQKAWKSRYVFVHQIQSAVKVNEQTTSPGHELTYNDRSSIPPIDHTQLDR